MTKKKTTAPGAADPDGLGGEQSVAAGADAVQATLVRARVLVACAYGGCDDVVEIESSLIDSLAGVVDTHPDAVAYAESIAKE